MSGEIIKMNKLNRLTWKYFFEQKWEEVSQVLLCIFIIISVAGVVFQVGWICEGAGSEEGCIEPYEPMFNIWVMISGLITTGIWVIVGLIYWIKTNWKWAREKAKERLRRKRMDVGCA